MSDPTLQRTPAFNLNEGPASMSMSVSNEVVHPGARLKLPLSIEGVEGGPWTLPIDATSLTTGSLFCL